MYVLTWHLRHAELQCKDHKCGKKSRKKQDNQSGYTISQRKGKCGSEIRLHPQLSPYQHSYSCRWGLEHINCISSRGGRPLQKKVSEYDIKLHLVMTLHLCSSLLLLFQDRLCSRVVISIRLLTISLINLFKNYLYLIRIHYTIYKYKLFALRIVTWCYIYFLLKIIMSCLKLYNCVQTNYDY